MQTRPREFWRTVGDGVGGKIIAPRHAEDKEADKTGRLFWNPIGKSKKPPTPHPPPHPGENPEKYPPEKKLSIIQKQTSRYAEITWTRTFGHMLPTEG